MFNIELPYDLAIPLLGIPPRELKIYAHTKTCTQMFFFFKFISLFIAMSEAFEGVKLFKICILKSTTF